MEGHTSLVVPLPGIVRVAPPLGRGPAAPHIALLEPFAPLGDLDEGAVAELGSYFADVVAFEVRFTALSQVPGGPPFLTPERPAPFRHLTQGVLRLFPEVSRPSEGVDRWPRLRVRLFPGQTLDDLHREIDPWLPVATTAREAALWWMDGETTQTLATMPFGMSAA